MAFAELDDGSVRTARSDPVREPLETGPSPDSMAWMTDFGEALKAGMALVVPDLPDTLVELRRLIVVGARGTLGPADSAAELERLLDAQHYTRGLALAGPGTPTNSLPGARAGYTSRPAPSDVVAIERRRFLIGMRPSPLCQPGDESDGTALARALGVGTGTLAYVARADSTDGRDGAELRSLLADATRGRLTALLDGILDPGTVAMLLGFAIEFVSPSGPLPVLRIGSQPYGLLPILLRDELRPPAPGTLADQAMPVLERLRASWSAAAAGVPWVGEPGSNPGETLIQILQRDGVARRIAFRPMLGPQLGDEVVAGLTGRTPVGRQRAAAAAAIGALGAQDPMGSGLLHALHVAFAPELQAPVIEPADAVANSPQQASQYLELVAAAQPDRLLRHDYGGAERPRSLLFALARLAMLSRADEYARAVLLGEGQDPTHWDDERVVPGRDPYATPLGRLEATDPTDGFESIAFELSELGRDVGVLDDVRQTLRRLKVRPPELLEELVRSSLGLFSHRLDPWYTAFAVERLGELRNDPQTSTGLCVGAFGVVERIRMAPRRASTGQPGVFTSPVNGGYVHAPSVNHGAAAAVLRSVHLAHASAGHGEAFSVDLSSERVRRALELLEGIRAGQPLAALLGYRIERGLADEGLQRLIAGVRAAAPLLAHKLTAGTEPAEKVAASNVVDGLTLLADAGYHGDGPPTSKILLAHHPALRPLPTPDRKRLDRVLRAAADTLDAVADLALSESVFQTVQGSPARAGAAVDALAGTAQAGDPGVVRTPRTGVGVTHRLLVLIGDGAPAVSGWAATPRALAEPRLEAWAQAWLPPPAQIGVRLRFTDDTGVVAQLDDLTLAGLHADAIAAGRNDLPLSALDVVVVAQPAAVAQRSALELRLLALAELQRPANAGDALIELVFDRGDDWDATVFAIPETLEIGRALRDIISRSRPLAPADLASSGSPPTTAINPGELATRAADAVTALGTVVAALEAADEDDDTTVLRQALFAADRFGVHGAAPTTLRDTPGTTHAAADIRAAELAGLHHQAAAALAEMARRGGAAAEAAGDPAAVLTAVFGEGFVVLPSLTPAGEASAPFAAAAAPGGFDPAAARTWLARAAPIRAGAGALDAALGYADAASAEQDDAVAATLRVGQLGGEAGERWLALPAAAGETIPGGRVSLVAVTPGADEPVGTLAGLFVDEWIEVVPSAQETTSVAFHLEAPSSAAPQTWLIGVPPAGREAWTEQDALQIVEEALALARLRLVELDDVTALGQLLPSLITAENPDGDAVGLDIEVLTREGP